jgi:hypothetical protein
MQDFWTFAKERFAAAVIVLVALALSASSAGEAAQETSSRPLSDSDNSFQYPFVIDEDALSGVADRSSLNYPLRASAKIVAHDGHFWEIGPDLRAGSKDDKRVRLYGVNLTFQSNFPTPSEAVSTAKRLRKLGFNAVRLHQMDTKLDAATNPPKGILTSGPYPSFNNEAVSRLREFIRVLSAEGIYVDLNLHVGYVFRPGIDDGVLGHDPNAIHRAKASPIIVFDPRLLELQRDYARGLIRRLGLKDNPALALVEINNEASLLSSWQHKDWGNTLPSAYRRELQQRWRDWLTRRYGDLEAACTAWKGCGLQGADTLLSPRTPDSMTKLSSVTGSDPERRTRDFVSFLADIDRAYFEAMAKTVREETDANVPITGTQMGNGGPPLLQAQEHMSYIDAHFYIDYQKFPKGSKNPRDWWIRDTAITNGQMADFLSVGLLRDYRKPFVVSEYNQQLPSHQAAEIVPLTAIYASLQDWDGLFFFSYGDAASETPTPGYYGLRGDWGKFVHVGQSAVLFRHEELPPLSSHLKMPMSPDQQISLLAEKDKDSLLHYFRDFAGFSPESAWRTRVSVDPTAANRSIHPITFERDARSDYNYGADDHLFQLRGSNTWGLFGRINNAFNGSSGISVKLDRPGSGYLSILLSAEDGQRVENSHRLLLSIGSGTNSSQPGETPPRPKRWIRYPGQPGAWTIEPDPGHSDEPSGSRSGSNPAWLSAFPMELSWPTTSDKAVVYPLNSSGQRTVALPDSRVHVAEGSIRLQLNPDLSRASPWYEVELQPRH